MINVDLKKKKKYITYKYYMQPNQQINYIKGTPFTNSKV